MEKLMIIEERAQAEINEISQRRKCMKNVYFLS